MGATAASIASGAQRIRRGGDGREDTGSDDELGDGSNYDWRYDRGWIRGTGASPSVRWASGTSRSIETRIVTRRFDPERLRHDAIRTRVEELGFRVASVRTE
jgi:hypothetical protein